MAKSFLEFVEDKKKDSNAVASKATLGDGNDFEPFVVSDDPNSEHYGSHSSLAPIIRAFKKGANWGWSKDDKTGVDKAVKISGKKIFLTGGAVRDHLAGKKPRNIELTTNSSPDELYHILKQNGFEFSGDSDGDGKQTFWVMEKDVNGRPYKFGVRVKNDEYEMSIFSSNPKGIPGEFQPGNQEQDASSRDFTINAMSLALSNDNGPNKELNDFFGGLHHLKAGQVIPVGDWDKKLEEDPTRALRYARMLTRYGKPETVQDSDRESISKIAPKINSCDRKKTVDEFMRVLDYEDGDRRGALKIYGDLGLLDGLFPGMSLEKELPKELKEMGDKHMPLAWMLKNHMPDEIESGMKGFDPEMIKKIMFLIKSMHIEENIDPSTLADLRSSYFDSGVSSRGLKGWTTKLARKDERLVDAFIQHVRSPRIKVYISENNNDVHEDFSDLVDPFTGGIDIDKVDERKKQLEYRNFTEILKKYIPKK